MSCAHENFRVQADVSRLVDREEHPDPHAFDVELTVHCTDCGEPFGWKGEYPCGYSINEPMVSPDKLTLRAPLLTPSELKMEGPLPGLPPDARRVAQSIRVQNGMEDAGDAIAREARRRHDVWAQVYERERAHGHSNEEARIAADRAVHEGFDRHG